MQNRQKVVIKEIKTKFRPERVNREIRREAQALLELDHKNIIKLVDFQILDLEGAGEQRGRELRRAESRNRAAAL